MATGLRGADPQESILGLEDFGGLALPSAPPPADLAVGGHQPYGAVRGFHGLTAAVLGGAIVLGLGAASALAIPSGGRTAILHGEAGPEVAPSAA